MCISEILEKYKMLSCIKSDGTIMNEGSLYSILNHLNPNHNIETVEYLKYYDGRPVKFINFEIEFVGYRLITAPTQHVNVIMYKNN
jgi:hypothetical protein